ncbi:MAG: AmmeMemoRadiSam system radical SAM enzyme [Desulfobacterales bacterium]|jgi:pyruvate formate lyase activating enzyme|nr:AmmeMemoRadiSam system radical SAM enzyme [Desulfobacterales bacterium]
MKTLSRRKFLVDGARLVASCTAAAALGPFTACDSRAWAQEDVSGAVFKGDGPKQVWKWSREGYAYQRLDEKQVACLICPNHCVLSPGDRSVCRSKVNLAGTLYSLAYGNACAVHVDPIEKKPLYHFAPRSTSFSIAAAGCNFRCLNCQNWEISQAKPHEVRHRELFPEDAVNAARQAGCHSIAYTYSEPVTFYEYMLDTAQAARGAGLRNLLISNGYINRPPLLDLCRAIDAANINLKAYSDAVYRKLNGGRLAPVLAALKTLHDQGVHLEITNLVVPTYVDDEELVRRMCAWILKEVGPDHPLHFLRFQPLYKLDRLPPTPVSTLARFREIALSEGIRYAYVGNVPGHEGNHTYCHNCRKLLVARNGYFIREVHLAGSRCEYCGTPIPGVWT